MMSDDFIDSIISAEHESKNAETETMISREFNGMEAVAQFESQAPTEAYRNNTDDERSES